MLGNQIVGGDSVHDTCHGGGSKNLPPPLLSLLLIHFIGIQSLWPHSRADLDINRNPQARQFLFVCLILSMLGAMKLYMLMGLGMGWAFLDTQIGIEYDLNMTLSSC